MREVSQSNEDISVVGAERSLSYDGASAPSKKLPDAWRRKSASPNSRRNFAVCTGSRVSRSVPKSLSNPACARTRCRVHRTRALGHELC